MSSFFGFPRFIIFFFNPVKTTKLAKDIDILNTPSHKAISPFSAVEQENYTLIYSLYMEWNMADIT